MPKTIKMTIMAIHFIITGKSAQLASKNQWICIILNGRPFEGVNFLVSMD
jgi:hypothetical protein